MNWPPAEFDQGAPDPFLVAMAGGAPAPAIAPAPPPEPPMIGPSAAPPAPAPSLAPAEAPPMPPPVSDELAGAPPPVVPPPGMLAEAPPAAPQPPGPTQAAGGNYSPPPPPMIGPPPAPEPPPMTDQERAAARQRVEDPLSIADPAEREKALVDLAIRDPIRFSQIQTRHEEERRNFADAAKLSASVQSAQAARDNFNAYQRALTASRNVSQQIAMDAQRLADDPTAGISGIAKASGLLGSIVGGLVQGRTGAARNAGLDAFDDMINRHIALRKDAIAARKGAMEQELAMHGDLYRAQEAFRQAAYVDAIRTIESEAALYDQRGTTAIKLGQDAQQTRARLAAVQQASEEVMFKRNYEVQKLLMERDKARAELAMHAETMRHNRASEGIDWARIQQQALDRREAKEARLQQRADTEAEKRDERVRQFAIGGLPRVQLSPDGKPVIGDDGKPVVTNAPLLNRDGKPWLAASPEEHNDISKKLATAGDVVSIIHRVMSIRDRVGGQLDLLNSDETQELKVLENRLSMDAKEGTEGLSSENDMKIVKGGFAASDLTSWRSNRAGLLEVVDRVEEKANRMMRTAKYDGPPIHFPNPYAEVKNTAEDDRMKDVMQKPSRTRAELITEEYMRLGREDMPVTSTRAVDNPFAQQSQAAPLSSKEIDEERWKQAKDNVDATFIEGADPSQQKRIAQLGSSARGKVEWEGEGPNPVPKNDAARAIVELQKIADSADTPTLRKLARHELEMVKLSAGSE